MTEHCPDFAAIIYNDYVLPGISAVSALSIVYAMFLYTKARMNGRLQSPKVLFIAGIVFFTMVLTLYISATNKSIFYCHNPILSNLFRVLDIQIYIIQMLLLFGILFYRMIEVFTNTVFELSSATITFFVAFYILTWVVLILFAIIFSTYWLSGVWIVGYMVHLVVAVTCAVCVFALNVSLISLFVYKLVQTFQSLSTNRNNLLHLITKTSLLFFASVFTLLLFLISPALRTFRSIHLDFVCHLMLIADIYTNFMCVFLSYEFVENYYDKICGCCHRKCYGCCAKCIAKENGAMPRLGLQNVASNASQSSVSGGPKSTEKTEI